MKNDAMNALYISYDGALDPLGSSQIIPYLIGLSQKGINFTLLTYEKKQRLAQTQVLNKLKKTLEDNNIKWEILRYHKSPTVPATAFDITAGIIKGLIIVIRDRVKIIHARSFIGAIPAFFLSKLFNLRFIFDIRGFWPEERVDGGLWKEEGFLFKIAKLFEKEFILNSDQIVVLTWKAKEIIQKQYLNRIKRRIEVIPTCVDLSLFAGNGKDNSIIAKIDKSGRFIFTYLGSTGTWYCLKEMVDFFKIARQKISNAYFLFLTSSGKKDIEDLMLSKGLSSDDFLVKSIHYRDVPEWLSVSDATVFFIKPLFSKKSSCPTKFAESLACGIPVITNSGIGDCDKIINEAGVGISINDFSTGSYLLAIDKIRELVNNTQDIRRVCRRAAERYFSLEDGIAKYLEIYRTLK